MSTTIAKPKTLPTSVRVNMLRMRQVKPICWSDPMTIDEDKMAEKLFNEFWKKYPHIKNPTDINMTEKAEFLVLKGFESIRLMQRARKQKKPYSRPDEDDEVEDLLF
jgi:hypothetical protein